MPCTLKLQFTFINFISFKLQPLIVSKQEDINPISSQKLRLRDVNCHSHCTATRECLVFKSHSLRPSFLSATLEMTSCAKVLGKLWKNPTFLFQIQFSIVLLSLSQGVWQLLSQRRQVQRQAGHPLKWLKSQPTQPLSTESNALTFH